MQIAAQTCLTKGVVLVGAGAIAISPLTPALPDIQIAANQLSHAVVDLSASTNPITLWTDVLQTAFGNLGTLGQQFLSAPAPIVQQVLSNQLGNVAVLGASVEGLFNSFVTSLQDLPSALQQGFAQIGAGDLTGAYQTILASFLPAVGGLLTYVPEAFSVVSNTVQNLANLITYIPNIVEQIAIPVVFPIVSVVNATLESIEQIVTAPNLGDAFNALINVPANLVGGLLNGSGTIAGIIPIPGLLSGLGALPPLTSGPLAALLNVRLNIADVLAPNPNAPATATLARTTATAASGTPVNAVVSRAAQTFSLAVPKQGSAAATSTDSGAVTGDTAGTQGKPAPKVVAKSKQSKSGTVTTLATAQSKLNKAVNTNAAKKPGEGLKKALASPAAKKAAKASSGSHSK